MKKLQRNPCICRYIPGLGYAFRKPDWLIYLHYLPATWSQPIPGRSMDKTANRVFGLDLLRALAIICVVYQHGYFLVEKQFSQPAYLSLVLDGVTMFFVLSGFLIGRILLRTFTREDFGVRTLVEFWLRRWFRTLPNYFLVLTLIALYIYLQGWQQSRDLALYFIFSQNIASPHPAFFQEAWSLTIEEWFYLCTPIPIYLACRLRDLDRRKLILAWIVSVIVAVTLFRLYRAAHGFASLDDWDSSLRRQVVTRLDSLMYGVLGAYLSIYHAPPWNRHAKSALLAGCILLLADKAGRDIFLNKTYIDYFNLTLSPIGALLLLPFLSSWKRDKGVLVGTITFISLVSYSMYLLNYTPFRMIAYPRISSMLTAACGDCSRNPALLYVVYWMVVIAASGLLYRYFERPMTALRDRWHMRGQSAIKAYTAGDLSGSSGSSQ